MATLLTGGSGRLGTDIQKYLDCKAPSSKELDILSQGSCLRAMNGIDTIIHCAGYVNSTKAEIEKEKCWNLNVVGTQNLVRAADGRRFIYISTDYVFDGERGNYSEEDVPSPVNYYGLTKLVAENIVRQYQNTLVLRAPFRPNPPWGFKNAFTDQWTSCDFSYIRAKDVAEVSMMSFLGTLHIGGERRSIYDMASSVSNVGKMLRSDFPAVRIPRDTSLNSSKWKELRNGKG